MVKCPFCDFMNEDGALFCEQCKSDLSGVPVTASASPPPSSPPMAALVEEAVPLASEAAIPLAEVEPAVPVAEVIEAEPVISTMPADTMPAPVTLPPPPAPAPVAAPAPVPAMAPPASAPTAAPAGDGAKLAADAQPKLVVLRGQRIKAEYPIYEGHNFIGRADEKPVDIDLEDQEPPDRVWCSRQHALITFEEGALVLEDLNSANGTYVNRNRVYPGSKKPLSVGDVIQIGNVQLKVQV